MATDAEIDEALAYVDGITGPRPVMLARLAEGVRALRDERDRYTRRVTKVEARMDVIRSVIEADEPERFLK